LLQWDLETGAADWEFEIGSITEPYLDGEGRIYIVERLNLDQVKAAGLTKHEGSTTSGWYTYLTILDGESGKLISRTELVDIPILGENANQLFPAGRLGNLIYLRNYSTYGLYAFDLEKGAFTEDRWKLCDRGYPLESVFLPQENDFVTFCMDFSTGMHSVVTRLSIDEGSSTSITIPQLGTADYMTGNGFAMGPGHRAYVVDSDAGALVEIDVDSMRVLRTAYYKDAVQPGSWLQRLHAWLLELAASPARAKRWLAEPAISPDGRSLAVDGGLSEQGGASRSVWLVDLESLQASQEIELSGSPHTIRFASNELLYILLQNEGSSTSNDLVVYDLAGDQAYNFSFETRGWLSELMVLQ
jgi:hypothetical protein